MADVGLDSRTAGSEAVYSYLAPSEAEVGQGWMIPLGPRRVLGYVLAIRDVTEEDLGFPLDKLKPLERRTEGLDIPAQTIGLILETANQCLVKPSLTLGLACPPGIKNRLTTEWKLVAEPSDLGELTAPQQETIRILKEEGGIVDRKSNPLSQGAKSTLRALQRRGIAEQMASVTPLSDRQRIKNLLRLTSDSEKVEEFLKKGAVKRPAQAAIIMGLQGAEEAAFSAQEIRSMGGAADTTIRALLQAGLLEEVEEGSAGPSKIPPTPNPKQAVAIEQITAAITDHRNEEFLLYGVTGSGKTEVYLRAAAEALKWGRQVLYLVPEIALTAQVIAQLRDRFGSRVAVLHSYMTPAERLESWQRVQSGESPVVLGPRSALFAPLSNIGLIVMDEEHEASYKQENTPRYHTKRAAQHLAKVFKCPLVLGSATPSIESYQQALAGQLTLLQLPARAASAKMPSVHIEDLTLGYKERRPSVFSPRLQSLLIETRRKGRQSILFLNRRAYSPFLMCRECGHKFECENCSVTLAFHRRENRLKCHQCDLKVQVPEACPECQGTMIKPFGAGAEKVQEEVQNLLPDANVARIDRDIARRKGAVEETLARFRSREIDILVGTQMVAKGLDFPNVTLVGVIAADISLNLPDFRASERTFQLLSQVGGRAGRGDHLGEVVIQTFLPDHYAVMAAQAHDFEGFYDTAVLEREAAGYPPYARLVNIIFTGENREEVVGLSTLAAKKLRKEMPKAQVLGPAFCPIERRKNEWRRHILLKLRPDADPGPIQEHLEGMATRTVRLSIDVDPNDLG